LGAAYATLGAFVVGFVTSWHLGRKVFPLPYPKDSYKVAIASIGMALVLWPTHAWRGFGELIVQILIGGTAYATMLVSFHFRRTMQLIAFPHRKTTLPRPLAEQLEGYEATEL